MGIILTGESLDSKEIILEKISDILEDEYSSMLLSLDGNLHLLSNLEYCDEEYYTISLINLYNLGISYQDLAESTEIENPKKMEDEFIEFLETTYKIIKIVEKDIEVTL